MKCISDRHVTNDLICYGDSFSPLAAVCPPRFKAFYSDLHVARQRIFIASYSSAANQA
jgi:hypothetical protein